MRGGEGSEFVAGRGNDAKTVCPPIQQRSALNKTIKQTPFTKGLVCKKSKQ